LGENESAFGLAYLSPLITYISWQKMTL
jgi:hypothetical protein